MHELSFDQFFSIEGISYADLFEDTLFVWEALHKLKTYLSGKNLGQIKCPIPPSAHLAHPEAVSIGEGSIIEPGAYIQGPCLIGKRCLIRHGSYIREGVLVGDDVVIGHDTEIKHSILLNGARAAHFNYVGDSIIGSQVNLGAGVKCANVRLDQDFISFFCNGVRVKTNLKKLGAIVGDRAQIGCNAVLGPGALLGKGALCYPCLYVTGMIPSRGRVRASHKNVIEEMKS